MPPVYAQLSETGSEDAIIEEITEEKTSELSIIEETPQDGYDREYCFTIDKAARDRPHTGHCPQRGACRYAAYQLGKVRSYAH